MEREEILEKIEQLKKQLEELNGQIIDFELPKNYEKMSKISVVFGKKCESAIIYRFYWY